VAVIAVLLTASLANAQSLTRPTFRALDDIQKIAGEERYDEAMIRLEALIIKVKEIPYDYAIANQYLAHISITMDKPGKARQALEEALAVPNLPPELLVNLKLFYGTVLLGDEEFAGAATVLEEWLALAEKIGGKKSPPPKPPQVFNVAYASYMSGKVERSEALMARAFDMIERKQIPDAWIQVYYRILFDRKKYSAAENLVLDLVARDPGDEQYWRLLASHYMQLEQSGDALAAIMLAYWNELIAKPDDLKNIVSLYSYLDIPEKAARLLETWLAEEKIPADMESLRQLGNLWLLARDRAKAKSALEKAASRGSDGKIHLLLGGIHFEDEDWAEAHSAYKSALRLGGLEEPYQVSLLAGISAFRAGMKDEARSALREAAKSEKYKAQAETILKQLERA
jgi:uncharacterized protein HemY